MTRSNHRDYGGPRNHHRTSGSFYKYHLQPPATQRRPGLGSEEVIPALVQAELGPAPPALPKTSAGAQHIDPRSLDAICVRQVWHPKVGSRPPRRAVEALRGT